MIDRPLAGAVDLDGIARAANDARWLQVCDGSAPILLIAPHGGQAGPATRATLNPKVNDLYTAEITHDLARRLNASAVINAGMDRNRLDLNRLTQVMDDAPWVLDLIAARIEKIVAARGRAVALLIHGWNVVEPRVDIGIGIKSSGTKLLPACDARISATDNFVNGPLLRLVDGLRRSRIEPTFGLRYPGAGANNLLQAFTERHAASHIDTLRHLAELRASGVLEAVQLELSVALRMPGRFREHAIDAITDSFTDRAHARSPAPQTNGCEADRIEIIRVSEVPRLAPRRGDSRVSSGPRRVGLEFYDPSAQLGVMASFDLGAAAAGARVMALLGRERIALFTAEGRVEQTASSLCLGPLSLRGENGRVRFDFAGPAVVVEDGSAYLSVERALAAATLHEAIELHAEFERWPVRDNSPEAQSLIELIARPDDPADGIFGGATGEFSIAGDKQSLSGPARIGRSFVGIGSGAFKARQMMWAAFDGGDVRAVEARMSIDKHGVKKSSGRILGESGWIEAAVDRLSIAPASRLRPPQRIDAALQRPGEPDPLVTEGGMRSFVMLSRPGPEQSRIVTSLGFASFRIGNYRGAGMFERSHRSAPRSRPSAESTDDNGEN
jgi:hypothetical protein